VNIILFLYSTCCGFAFAVLSVSIQVTEDEVIIENIIKYGIMDDLLIRSSVVSVLGAGNTYMESKCHGLWFLVTGGK
jgi:hypothetical protein